MTYTQVAGERVPIRMWADPAQVEAQAMQQLRNISALPWVHGMAVMPDVHYGKGATVGSVIAMREAVSPAAVGVDIGCGMSAVKTSLRAQDLPDDLSALRSAIEAAIPVGFGAHAETVDTDAIPDLSTGGWDRFWAGFDGLTDAVADQRGKAGRQMGSLGSGNHFVEFCVDTTNAVWLMLHSGSRGIGNLLAQRHMSIARDLPHNQDLPDRDLAVFVADTEEMAAYRRDLFWAQEYAKRNRAVMMALLKTVVRKQFKKAKPSFEPEISCHHNYVAEERYEGVELLVTRKGAIRAGSGDLGIIPGSMGTGSYIVRGRGNPDAFNSASHGAGRKMSRTKAKKHFTTADLEHQTKGVECRKDAGVLDEIPGAYKNIKQVMAQQTDLVEVVAHLKQVVCVKG